jgi:hypothetical protein
MFSSLVSLFVFLFQGALGNVSAPVPAAPGHTHGAGTIHASDDGSGTDSSSSVRGGGTSHP